MRQNTFIIKNMKKMRILLACEESQAVTKAFRKLNHDAFSCDILPCSGGHSEWHIQGDVLEQLHKGWDMMIAHPPCKFLAVSGNRWLYNKDGSKNKERWDNRELALDFVKKLMNAPIDKIAIENPISVISSQIRKPDQIIQPWMFGDKAQKSTCLWLKGLPKLVPTDIVDKGEFIEFISKKGVKKRQPKWYFDALKNAKTSAERSTLRSKTFQGIADAIASQWG